MQLSAMIILQESELNSKLENNGLNFLSATGWATQIQSELGLDSQMHWLHKKKLICNQIVSVALHLVKELIDRATL
jgi:hypothetical protein